MQVKWKAGFCRCFYLVEIMNNTLSGMAIANPEQREVSDFK